MKIFLRFEEIVDVEALVFRRSIDLLKFSRFTVVAALSVFNSTIVWASSSVLNV